MFFNRNLFSIYFCQCVAAVVVVVRASVGFVNNCKHNQQQQKQQQTEQTPNSDSHARTHTRTHSQTYIVYMQNLLVQQQQQVQSPMQNE